VTPLLAYACVYALGIVIASQVDFPPVTTGGMALVLAGVTGILAWRGAGRLAMWLLALVALLSGATTYECAMQPGRWDPCHLPPSTEVALHGHLVRDLPDGQRRAKTFMRVRAGKVGSEVLPLRGVVVVEAFHPPEVTAGSEVVVVGRIAPMRKATESRQFDEADHYGRRYGAFVRVRHAAVIPVARVGPPTMADVRRYLVEECRATCPQGDGGIRAGVMLSMVFGASSLQIPEETMESFRRAGTVHVLVVSGAQLALLAGMGAWVAGALRLRPWWELALVLLLALSYALLLPMDGTILRAMALIVVLYVGRALQRDPDLPLSLVAALMALLLIWPGGLYDLSLRLSALALLGVVYGLRILGPREIPAWRRRPLAWAGRGMWATAAASLGASLATIPLIAGTWGTVSLVAPLANLVAVPIASVLTILMFVSTVLAPIWSLPAEAVNYVGGLLAELLIRSTELVGGHPWASVEVTDEDGYAVAWPDWLVAVCYLVLAGAVWGSERVRRARRTRRSDLPAS
jgi:ComEC/Rec2-related protein